MPTALATASRFGPTAGLSRGITRRELFVWMAVCLLANITLHSLDTGSFAALAISLASQNLISLFSFYVVLLHLSKSDPRTRANQIDLAIVLVGCFAMVVFSCIGYRFGVGVPATVVAIFLLAFHRGDAAFRSAGIVLMAVSVNNVWAPIAFRYLSPYILWADTAIVKAILGIVQSDVRVVDTTFYAGNDHAVSLVGACSSFNNVSIAMLAYVSVASLVRTRCVRSDLIWPVALSALMILFNAARLGALASNYEAYLFWHDEIGAQYFKLGQSAIIVVIAYVGAHQGNPS